MNGLARKRLILQPAAVDPQCMLVQIRDPYLQILQDLHHICNVRNVRNILQNYNVICQQRRRNNAKRGILHTADLNVSVQLTPTSDVYM